MNFELKGITESSYNNIINEIESYLVTEKLYYDGDILIMYKENLSRAKIYGIDLEESIAFQKQILLGKKIGVDYAITGLLGFRNGVYLINIFFMDISSGKIMGDFIVYSLGDIDSFINAVKGLLSTMNPELYWAGNLGSESFPSMNDMTILTSWNIGHFGTPLKIGKDMFLSFTRSYNLYKDKLFLIDLK